MDLRIYYQKIRETQAKMPDAFPVVVSNDTADGGKQGTTTEVTRALAAKLIVDGTARLAEPKEAAEFQQRQAAARKAIEDERAASKVQLTVVPKELLEQMRKKG